MDTGGEIDRDLNPQCKCIKRKSFKLEFSKFHIVVGTVQLHQVFI